MPSVLMPLPAADFDPTEAGVTWRILTASGHVVRFATPDGRPARADPRMLEGRGLGPWRPWLRADGNGREACAAMTADPRFATPLAYDQLDAVDDFDGLVLPGGHAPGMRTYLESTAVQRLVGRAFASDRPVGAICHGVVVAARSTDPRHGRSVLWGRRTTALTRPQEALAWRLTRWWLGDYYRTYPAYVEAEVRAALRSPRDFDRGPLSLRRDAPGALERGFVVRDGNYLSARWPGDAHRFATELSRMLARP